MKFPHHLPVLSVLFAAVAFASACSSGSGDDAGQVREAEAPATFTADSVRQDASTAMAAIDTVKFVVRRTGAEVSIDDAGLAVFQEASGRYAAPASADAVVAVLLLGSKVELGAVAIDGTLFLTDPLSGAWQDATGTVAFDPAKIFSTDAGIAKVLATGMKTATLVSDTPDADGMLHLQGTVEAADVDTLTSGLVSEEATADVTIDAETFLVQSITFDTPIDEGVATWLVELSDYGSSVDITAPDLAGS